MKKEQEQNVGAGLGVLAEQLRQFSLPREELTDPQLEGLVMKLVRQVEVSLISDLLGDDPDNEDSFFIIATRFLTDEKFPYISDEGLHHIAKLESYHLRGQTLTADEQLQVIVAITLQLVQDMKEEIDPAKRVVGGKNLV